MCVLGLSCGDSGFGFNGPCVSSPAEDILCFCASKVAAIRPTGHLVTGISSTKSHHTHSEIGRCEYCMYDKVEGVC